MFNALLRTFAHFLGHHKAGAGAMTRSLKMRLQEQRTAAVWPDCNRLRNLASLLVWEVQSEASLLLLPG